ncbi:hypothetical protein J4441_04470 [Candidatus Micrarchaeota archaeon]|nr:hypothetical protein [Candidatus Micrarchaeota archaeon]
MENNAPDGVPADDETMRKMRPDMETAARILSSAGRNGKFVLVRFHCDADGITSGIALWKALGSKKAVIMQNGSAIYEMRDAVRDLNNMLGYEKPLLVLADFGANEESREAHALMRAAGVETMVIDHHPHSQKTASLLSLFVSPHKEGMGGTSDYAAGFLCSRIATIAGADEKAMHELARLSLCGDKSKFASDDAQIAKKALVLDYLASFGNFNNAGEFYSRVLSREEVWMEFYSVAQEKLDRIREAAAPLCKVHMEGNVGIVVVPLEKLSAGRNEFPSPGKTCGVAYDALRETGKPFVGIGHSKRTVNFRASKEALESGFSARKIITALKGELPNCIEAGGGHDGAASIRVREGCDGIVLEAALKKTKEWAVNLR